MHSEKQPNEDNVGEKSWRSGTWSGNNQRLDRVITDLKLVRSRSQATEFITAGLVDLNGEIVRKPGTKVAASAQLRVRNTDRYVGRAAYKLLAGLETFSVDPSGAHCLDVGASTGGFTQVLLEHGAAHVTAVDVGHDQMVPMLSADDRVSLFEGCNARDMKKTDIGLGKPEAILPTIVVADLSFISLKLVLSAMVNVAAPEADFLLLVKPQFEVGRSGVKSGIVTNPHAAAHAVHEVIVYAAELGLGVHGIIPSPIPGGFGNQEFVIHLSKHGILDDEMCRSHLLELTTATIGTRN